jgi:hypothetical protein
VRISVVDPHPRDCLCVLEAARWMAVGILEGHALPSTAEVVKEAIRFAVHRKTNVVFVIVSAPEKPDWLS